MCVYIYMYMYMYMYMYIYIYIYILIVGLRCLWVQACRFGQPPKERLAHGGIYDKGAE